MATTKQCSKCGKHQPLTQFHKRAASPDLLQTNCKSCVKENNKNFRQTKPTYQIDWQRKNHKKLSAYCNQWAKENVCADDSKSAVYLIINPEQRVYVGSTQTLFSYRRNAHKKEYKLNNGVMPYLHHSFDVYGYDKHKWVILDMAGTDKETLRNIEYTMINHFHQLGMSLNKRLK